MKPAWECLGARSDSHNICVMSRVNQFCFKRTPFGNNRDLIELGGCEAKNKETLFPSFPRGL
jgi:hypothetical protein